LGIAGGRNPDNRHRVAANQPAGANDIHVSVCRIRRNGASDHCELHFDRMHDQEPGVELERLRTYRDGDCYREWVRQFGGHLYVRHSTPASASSSTTTPPDEAAEMRGHLSVKPH